MHIETSISCFNCLQSPTDWPSPWMSYIAFKPYSGIKWERTVSNLYLLAWQPEFWCTFRQGGTGKFEVSIMIWRVGYGGKGFRDQALTSSAVVREWGWCLLFCSSINTLFKLYFIKPTYCACLRWSNSPVKETMPMHTKLLVDSYHSYCLGGSSTCLWLKSERHPPHGLRPLYSFLTWTQQPPVQYERHSYRFHILERNFYKRPAHLHFLQRHLTQINISTQKK